MSSVTSFVKPFSKDGVFQNLSTKWIGRNIVYKDETPTTMDDAKELGMRGKPVGTAVLAELQTKARGAHDRQWNATNTGNIYVSFILHRLCTQQSFEGRFNVEVAAALAVVKAAHTLGIRGAQTKWPNDVWVEGHKLAGCLCEDTNHLIPDSSPPKGLSILGIGVNVNADVRRSPGLPTLATSMRCELRGVQVDRELFFSTMCNVLEANLDRDQADLHREFVSLHIFTPPCPLLFYPKEGGVKEASFLGVEENWSITVKTAEGQSLTSTSAECSIRPRPVRVAYVLKPTDGDSSSAELVFRALLALVNTASTAIKFLHPEDLEQSKWRQDACLVVVCGGDAPQDAVWIGKGGQALSAYLQEGGCLLALEQGAHLVSVSLSTPPFSVEKVEPSSVNLLNLELLEAEWAGEVIMALGNTNSVGFRLESDMEHQALAHFATPQSSSSSSSSPLAVAVVGVGRGKLGLCGINLAQSFLDPQSSAGLQQVWSMLDLYKIDSLFTQLLKKLIP